MPRHWYLGATGLCFLMASIVAVGHAPSIALALSVFAGAFAAHSDLARRET